MIGIHTFFLVLMLATSAIAQVVTCPTPAPTNIIDIAGSRTVQPIATAWGAAYEIECPGAIVNVYGSESSDGAKRVCGDTTSYGGPVDIGAMSRSWKTTEATVGSPYNYNCLIGTMPTVGQVDVAIESLVVILKKGSLPDLCIKALKGLTFAQLRWIFSGYTRAKLIATGWPASALANSDSNDKTHLYSELSASCPKTEIKLVGPSFASSSYTYFLETILTNYAAGETFDLLRPTGAAYFGTTTNTATINKVRFDPTGASIGFVYYNAYTPFMTTIRAVPLKKISPPGYVSPTTSTIDSGLYPLSHRIYMNVLLSTVAKTKTFIEYGMSAMGTLDVIAKGFYPIPFVEQPMMVARL